MSNDQLVLNNRGFAVSIAQTFQGRGVAPEDLVGAAFLGLVEASTLFVADMGVKFTTYATGYIRKYLSLIVRDRPTMSIPEYFYRYFPEVHKARIVLARGDDQPTDNEVIAYLERRLADDKKFNACNVLQAMRSLTTGSLNVATGDGERSAIGNVADRKTVDATEMIDIPAFLSRLSEIQRKVVTLHYGLDDGEAQDFASIGRTIGVSRERIRQIHRDAMIKMRSIA